MVKKAVFFLISTISEVDNLKGMLLQQNRANNTHLQVENPSDELKVVRQEAAQAQDSLKVMKQSIPTGILMIKS